MQPYILTLDIGSSSARCLLFDGSATQLPGVLAQRRHQAQVSQAGDLTFDLNALIANIVGVIDEALAQAGDIPIAAVAADTFVTNIVGVRAQGGELVPVTPLFTYAQPSAAPDVAFLRDELGPAQCEAVHDRTGCLLHSSYLPARFRWIARIHPDWMAQCTDWLSLGEYLLWQFTGVRRASYSVAAWTGLLDRRRLVWDAEWLHTLGLSEHQLSPLADVGDAVHVLRGPWAARWPALATVPWLPAVGDGAAANVGSGCVDVAHVALTLGTTGAMRVAIAPGVATLPAGLWLYRIQRELGLLGGATTEGGNLPAWLHKTLQLPPVNALESAFPARPPAAHGLTMLPFVAGERAPGWNDQATAALTGITLATSPLDIYQAALEAVAYRFALIFRQIAMNLPSVPTVTASGAALANSPYWTQMMADVLGTPMTLLAERELSCRGLALLALQYLGVIKTLADLPPAVAMVFAPDSTRHAVYAGALAEQVALYRRLLTA